VSLGPFASLNGIIATHCMLVLPLTGIWHADVRLSTAPIAPFVGPGQVLVLNNTTYTCAVVRSIDLAGVRMVRLVGGTGRWRTSIPAQQYASPIGVSTSVVLTDAAVTAGELPPVVGPTVPPTLGNAFVRRAGLASLVLQQVLGDTWWMDPLGVVQTVPRIPTPIATAFAAEDVAGAPGVYRIATESPDDWQPGSLFVGPTVSGTINRVMHVATPERIRTEVMVA